MSMPDGKLDLMQDAGAIWAEVHAALRRFIGKRVADQAQADDILQDIFLRVHRQLDHLNDPGRMTAWLYRITRNAIVDYYRSPDRRREVPAGLAGELDDPASAGSSRPDESGRYRTELAACLRPMVARLSSDYRDAVTLVELDGLTQQAAAERLGLSLSGMKSRVQRGRKQLKQLLDECCLIQLDRRRGVIDYEVRTSGCDPCAGPMQ